MLIITLSKIMIHSFFSVELNYTFLFTHFIYMGYLALIFLKKKFYCLLKIITSHKNLLLKLL